MELTFLTLREAQGAEAIIDVDIDDRRALEQVINRSADETT